MRFIKTLWSRQPNLQADKICEGYGMDGCPFPPGILLSGSSGIQSVLKSINFYKDHSRWTLQYPSSATACSSSYPQVMGASAHWSMHMVAYVARSCYPWELTGCNSLGMLFPLRTRNHFLGRSLFEDRPFVLSKLTLTTVFHVSVSTGKEKSLFCFLDSVISNFVSVEDKMRDGLILQQKSLDKILGKKNSPFKQEGLRRPGRSCLGRWWDLWK